MLRPMKQQPVNPELKPRRKFDKHFKEEAIALWLNSGRSAQTIAAELGLRDKQLYHWKKILGLCTSCLFDLQNAA